MANIITAGVYTYPAPTTVLLPLRGQCLRCRLATHPWGVQPKRNPATEQVLLLLHALLAFRHPVPSPAAAFFSTTRPQGCKLPCICNGAGVEPISFPPSIAPPSLQAGAVALWGLPQFRPKHCRPPPAPYLASRCHAGTCLRAVPYVPAAAVTRLPCGIQYRFLTQSSHWMDPSPWPLHLQLPCHGRCHRLEHKLRLSAARRSALLLSTVLCLMSAFRRPVSSWAWGLGLSCASKPLRNALCSAWPWSCHGKPWRWSARRGCLAATPRPGRHSAARHTVTCYAPECLDLRSGLHL
jgi:hypothetical protein